MSSKAKQNPCLCENTDHWWHNASGACGYSRENNNTHQCKYCREGVKPEKKRKTEIAAIEQFLNEHIEFSEEDARALETALKILNLGEAGLSVIDGGRYDLYIPGGYRVQCDAFHSLSSPVKTSINAVVELAKTCIWNFLRKLKYEIATWIIDECAILYSHNGGKKQAPHIDVASGAYQFFVNLCWNETESTYVFDGVSPTIAALEKKFDMNNLRHSSVIANYAPLLLPKDELYGNMVPLCKDTWNRGGIIGFPGGTVHSGPSYSGYRCVLFIIARPQKLDIQPDVQYTSWTLLEELARDTILFDDNSREKIYSRFLTTCVDWADYEPWKRWSSSKPKLAKSIEKYVKASQKAAKFLVQDKTFSTAVADVSR